MKILLSNWRFSQLTGSEIYYYELGKELQRRGHTVHIWPHTVESGILSEKAKSAGLKITFSPDTDYDICNVSQPEPTRKAVSLLNCPIIQTCQSEFSMEQPIDHPSIKSYVAIRPAIVNKVKGMTDKPVHLVYQGIDFSRFNTQNVVDDGYVLFVGTSDFLRHKTIMDLHKKYKDDLLLVGKGHKIKEINTLSCTWNVEDITKRAHKVASILLGRTVLEGWACGKPAIIYDIDKNGNIKGHSEHPPPEDTSFFDIEQVGEQIESIYQSFMEKN